MLKQQQWKKKTDLEQQFILLKQSQIPVLSFRKPWDSHDVKPPLSHGPPWWRPPSTAGTSSVRNHPAFASPCGYIFHMGVGNTCGEAGRCRCADLGFQKVYVWWCPKKT